MKAKATFREDPERIHEKMVVYLRLLVFDSSLVCPTKISLYDFINWLELAHYADRDLRLVELVVSLYGIIAHMAKMVMYLPLHCGPGLASDDDHKFAQPLNHGYNLLVIGARNRLRYSPNCMETCRIAQK